jgi:hypothetical protein
LGERATSQYLLWSNQHQLVKASHEPRTTKDAEVGEKTTEEDGAETMTGGAERMREEEVGVEMTGGKVDEEEEEPLLLWNV